MTTIYMLEADLEHVSETVYDIYLGEIPRDRNVIVGLFSTAQKAKDAAQKLVCESITWTERELDEPEYYEGEHQLGPGNTFNAVKEYTGVYKNWLFDFFRILPYDLDDASAVDLYTQYLDTLYPSIASERL